MDNYTEMTNEHKPFRSLREAYDAAPIDDEFNRWGISTCRCCGAEVYVSCCWERGEDAPQIVGWGSCRKCGKDSCPPEVLGMSFPRFFADADLGIVPVTEEVKRALATGGVEEAIEVYDGRCCYAGVFGPRRLGWYDPEGEGLSLYSAIASSRYICDHYGFDAIEAITFAASTTENHNRIPLIVEDLCQIAFFGGRS